ncbi:LysR family transcriptional regulator [Amorphus orientalis]|uniref:DNA-binding transcriptional LysR family regulator n=1 Tax=Amorphus orientalis TaxID=649198 RepID=A0AAE3VN86_9HYPH|nr:LysR family transcriptional regulator [Amorphus orientalis]MDQ0315167.1 DNA-binding transcriptional LysR family regulator [Amorphus orientalis]
MSVDAARIFIAICETGSFRHAAERVCRSASAVSLQVAKLENQLGRTLLERNARRVVLTEEGEALLGFARRLVAVSDETMAHFLGYDISGNLCVAAPHDLGVWHVPVLLKRFARTHPGVRVEVRLDSSNNVQSLFAEGKANVALFTESRTPRIASRELFSEELCWLGKRGGDVAQREPLSLAVAEVGCAWRDAALRALDAAERPYRVCYWSDTSMGQVAAVRADLAVAALPRALTDGGIAPVSSEFGLPRLGFVHMYLAEDGSPAARAFADQLGDWDRFDQFGSDRFLSL